MESIYLSLGSNLGARQENIEKALTYLGNDHQIIIDQVSDYYETSPVGGVEQGMFLNVAAKIYTTYQPAKLLQIIHQIEAALQRVRKVHWGPRTLDIDIIFWGTERFNNQDLIVPHKETFKRLFVLRPLLDIYPQTEPYFKQITESIAALEQAEPQQKVTKVPQKKDSMAVIEQAVTELLQAIGDDPQRAGIKETPQRVAKMYQEIFSSQKQSEFQDYKIFATPKKDNSQMVLVKNIPFYSMCEHHMLPFFGQAHVAYIPRNGKIIGLSKIPRLVDFVAHKLSLQEKITSDVAETLTDILDPLGVAVVVDARHMCIEMRGVKKSNSTTRTTYFTGNFDTDNQLRAEFLRVLN
ncbi:GTP cyclohydrolase I FolE [Liquorilactobacillus satsumensis]|uniref:GTP cyclohydrolase I FolE n=1 Tax=Liquorilactobacillus satsumensis TaxID=259059 RepID=UPI0021C367F3|nr:GTP cyclohydrolase I FolE [Liquorilactobacillus satsumensis]MCP9312842.1 GTP cyclohydrolase I FolE [Liquorilactobacillus satsumensis]MCP9359938.1 GTP cyclohydrolase I FolE [Liquorilactobacillus satsumensis]